LKDQLNVRKKGIKLSAPAGRAFKVPGFMASGVVAGVKKAGGLDLALILSDTPASVAGVFTTNRVKAAPVLLDMKRIRRGVARGVVVNSGNANACTGERGMRDAAAMAGHVEDALGLPGGAILVASTGVIGVPLPADKIRKAVPALVKALSPGGIASASKAIMTTDAFPKTASARSVIGGRAVMVGGVAKGAGMIRPDMATMLAFLMTDADIKGGALKRALRAAVDGSFNSIAVDNDTSTNDTVLVFANGRSGAPEIKEGTPAYRAFLGLLSGVSLRLAHLIVRDGEGATRFIEIAVRGAATEGEARKGARTVADSYLVKAAFFGGDPNWGRILAALGRSGIRMREGGVDISFNGVDVVKGGLDTGKEALAARALKAKDVSVLIRLNAGRGSAVVWTTDLTYDYVRINSAYRT
jgi:glutamate N-acetyltransferase/amino-acid N-acetyltransferase